MHYLIFLKKPKKIEIVICCKLQVALYGLNSFLVGVNVVTYRFRIAKKYIQFQIMVSYGGKLKTFKTTSPPEPCVGMYQNLMVVNIWLKSMPFLSRAKRMSNFMYPNIQIYKSTYNSKYVFNYV